MIHPSESETADPEPLSPTERLVELCDPGSLQVIRSHVESRRMGPKACAGDGVVAGWGTVSGRPVCCYAQDAAFCAGALGEAQADSIVRVLRMARQSAIPVVGFVESGGARMQEGLAALGGYGRIFYEHSALGSVVPQISVVTGTAAGGGAYGPALTDFVVMTERSAMFLTGPRVVRDAMGEDVSADALGGPRVHDRNGVSHILARDDIDAIVRVRELLAYLPQSRTEPGPIFLSEPAHEPAGGLAGLVPSASRDYYDMRSVIGAVVDGARLFEVSPRWARNMVTGFARLDGRAVGVVANQPRHLAGVIDCAASEKAARFVSLCNRFRIPLVVLVDTPGFLPGARQEAAGVIRHGATLLRAFATATVPRVTVIVRKAYGGAYITMNSKDLGADLSFAWPDAQIGIMGAAAAVGIIHRRAIASADDPLLARERLADDYAAEHLGAPAAARDGFVDEVISPSETRARLSRALHTLLGVGVRDRRPPRSGHLTPVQPDERIPA